MHKYKADDLVYLPDSSYIWSNDGGLEYDVTPEHRAEIDKLEALVPDGYFINLYDCGFVKVYGREMINTPDAIRIGWDGPWYVSIFPEKAYRKAHAGKVIGAPGAPYDEWCGSVVKILSDPFPDMHSALTALKFFGECDE